MTRLQGSTEGTAIATTDNTAYDVMKQKGREAEKDKYEMVDNPTRGNPSLPHLPAIPNPVAHEDTTYEIIPGDL